MSERTAILHIVKSLGRGGAEMLLQETLLYHDKSRFQFHCIYFLPWKDQMVAGIKNNGGIVENFSASNNIKIMLQVRKIAAYIKEHNIKLVHCHLPWAGFAGRLLHKLTGVPVVYTEHNLQERYRFATKTLNRITYNWQSAAVAVSSDVAKSIKENIKPAIPVHTILNGVDVNSFRRDAEAARQLREKWGIAQDAIVIGTIAVFRFQKRLKEWITTFKNTEAQHPGIRGIIVGDGILKDEVMQHLKASGMEDKIVMPGLQTAVKPWLSAMDIFMMSSVFEGLPIALLEAMSMECAVVSTDAGGVKEVIRSGTDGFLVPVEEWPNLQKELSGLIAEPEKIAHYGAAARKRIEQSFSMQSMVQQLEALYNDLLSK